MSQPTTVILAAHVTLMPIENIHFHITLQLLQTYQNISYAHHNFEIMVVIRSDARSFC